MPKFRPWNELEATRQRLGISQAALGRILGTSHQEIGRLIRGERKTSIDWIERAGEALGVPFDELAPLRIPGRLRISYELAPGLWREQSKLPPHKRHLISMPIDLYEPEAFVARVVEDCGGIFSEGSLVAVRKGGAIVPGSHHMVSNVSGRLYRHVIALAASDDSLTLLTDGEKVSVGGDDVVVKGMVLGTFTPEPSFNYAD